MATQVIGTARPIVPALRWHPDTGFDGERRDIDAALEIGVGGFCIFGGSVDAVRRLTAELQSRSRLPLLIGSDVERGAGQQFEGATSLPPLAAIGALDDHAVTRRAGRITARESLAVGVNWLFAPVADVGLEADNPIVGSRAFGTDGSKVARHVVAWIEGAQSEGVLCCAKHFPGHGRTTEDSHVALPRVTADRDELAVDLAPFAAAVRAGVHSVMTAHVVYDGLDTSAPATLSRGVLRNLLRVELGFDGLVVTDGLGMDAIRRAVPGGEAVAAVAALNAGCDMLLYPTNLEEIARAFADAADGAIDRARITEATNRINLACATTRLRGEGPIGEADDAEWADAIAERACRVVRGHPSCDSSVRLLTVDELGRTRSDVAAPEEFSAALAAAGVEVKAVDAAEAGSQLVIALYEGKRASRTMVRVTPAAADAVSTALRQVPDACVVVFGHEGLCEHVPGRHVLAAWGGEPIMQRAAGRRLAGGGPRDDSQP